MIPSIPGIWVKKYSYDDCRKLGDFVVNVILSNEGRAMYFDGYDFEENDYHVMHISYVANRIVYLDQEFAELLIILQTTDTI